MLSNHHYKTPLPKAIVKHAQNFNSKACCSSGLSSIKEKQQMNPFASFLLLLSSLAFLVSIGNGQDRAPHGIAHENPMAFSPSAYEFFHPKTQNPDTKNPCATSKCSPLPVAAEVDSNKALETKALPQQKPGHPIGAGGVVAIVFGLAFVVLSAMGVFYVIKTRRVTATTDQPNTVQLEA